MERKSIRTQTGSLDGFIVPKVKQAQRVKPTVPISTPKVEAPKSITEAPKLQTNTQPEFPRYYSPYSDKKPVPIKRAKHKKKWSVKRKVLTSMLVVLLIGFGGGAWYGSKILGSLDKAFHGNVFSDVHALFSNTKLKGEDAGRVNILLAGDSADDPGHGGADLTDSIMIVSIDTTNHTGFMLSVPRDLWVNIPEGGWGHQKINAANNVSNFSEPGYPSGGMGQLEQIVQSDLGIPIDYYALINYTAFRDAVNTVGGITINIQSPDPRGIYDSFTQLKLPNGMDTLNGQQALNLARARGDYGSGDVGYGLPNSDFSRTEHQREMLVALAQKASTVGVLADPLKVSSLFSALGNNVKTDLNLQDLLRFNQLTKGMNVTHLQSLTYQFGGTNSLLTGYLSPDGQEALIPTEGLDNFGQLKQYYQQLTSNNPVVREAPSVVVLNGSSISGLAHKVGDTLTSEGFNVVAVGDTLRQYPNSLIVDSSNGQKPASVQLLQTLLPRGTATTSSMTGSTEAIEAQGYSANFVVVLGQNTSTTNTQQP